MSPTARRRMVLGMLFACIAAVYASGLNTSTPYLSIEELTAAHHSSTLATTGRSLSGQWLPLYIAEPGYEAGRDPLWIYANAALLRIFAFSEALIRLPSVIAGLVDVVLMFVLARRVFGRDYVAAGAAALLAMTPAHFFHSRVATGQIGPLPFVLGWLTLVVGYLQSGRTRDLGWATACLGLGVYSYLAAAFMAPVYLAATLTIVYLRHRRDVPHGSAASLAADLKWAVGGFAVALIPWMAWHVAHPERFAQLLSYYTDNGYNEDLRSRGISALKILIGRLDIWWNTFNPERSLFSGDSNLRFSTRQIGSFLVPTAILVVAGLWAGRRQLGRELWILVMVGLVCGPLPAVLAGDMEIKRWLTVVPFVSLIAAAGLAEMSGSTRVAARVATAALFVMAAWQFAVFQSDYRGDYRSRSSFYFGGNLKGAVVEVLAAHPAPACVSLDNRVAIGAYWKFYTSIAGRPDLAQQLNVVDAERPGFGPAPSCRGNAALVVLEDRIHDNPAFSARLDADGWKKTPIAEPDGRSALAVYLRKANEGQ